MPRKRKVAQLYVDFRARTSEFVTDMGKANKALGYNHAVMRKLRREHRQFISSSKDMAKGLFSIQTAAVAAAGIAGLGLLSKQGAAYGRNLKEQSDLIGVNVENLQTYQRMLVTVDADQQTVNDSLREFFLRAADARSGMKSYQEAFDRAGVSLKDSNGQWKTNNQLWEEFIRNVKNLPKEDLLFITDELGGEDLQRQAGNLVEVSRRYDELFAKAKAGIIVTDQEAEALARLDKQYEELGRSIQVALAKAVAVNSDEIKKFVDQVITEIPKALPGMIKFSTAMLDMLKYMVQHGPSILRVAGVLYGGVKGAVVGAAFGPIGSIVGAVLGVLAVGGVAHHAANQLEGSVDLKPSLSRAPGVVDSTEFYKQLSEQKEALTKDVLDAFTPQGALRLIESIPPEQMKAYVNPQRPETNLPDKMLDEFTPQGAVQVAEDIPLEQMKAYVNPQRPETNLIVTDKMRRDAGLDVTPTEKGESSQAVEDPEEPEAPEAPAWINRYRNIYRGPNEQLRQSFQQMYDLQADRIAADDIRLQEDRRRQFELGEAKREGTDLFRNLGIDVAAPIRDAAEAFVMDARHSIDSTMGGLVGRRDFLQRQAGFAQGDERAALEHQAETVQKTIDAFAQQASAFDPEKLKEQYQKIVEEQKAIDEMNNRIAQSSALAKGAIHSVFDEIWMGAENLGDRMSNLFNQLVQELIRQHAIEPLAGAAGDFFGSLVAGGAGKTTVLDVKVYQNFGPGQDSVSLQRAGKKTAEEVVAQARAKVAMDERQGGLLKR